MKNVKNTVAMITLGVAGLGLGTIACTQTSEGEGENVGTSTHAYGNISTLGKPIAASGAFAFIRGAITMPGATSSGQLCRFQGTPSASGGNAPVESVRQATARIARNLGGAFVHADQQINHAFRALSADDQVRYEALLSQDFLPEAYGGSCFGGNAMMYASGLAGKLTPIGDRVGKVLMPDGVSVESVTLFGYAATLTTDGDQAAWTYLKSILQGFNCANQPFNQNLPCSFQEVIVNTPSSSGGNMSSVASLTMWIDPPGSGFPINGLSFAPTTVAGRFNITAAGVHFASTVRERDNGTGTNRWVVQGDAPLGAACTRFLLNVDSQAMAGDEDRWGSNVGTSTNSTVRENLAISTKRTCGSI